VLIKKRRKIWTKEVKEWETCWALGKQFVRWMATLLKFWHAKINCRSILKWKIYYRFVDIIFLFVLQVAKKENNLYPPRKYYFIFKFWNSCFALNYFYCLQNFEWIFFLPFVYDVYKQGLGFRVFFVWKKVLWFKVLLFFIRV
jgi:hypothetical protein